MTGDEDMPRVQQTGQKQGQMGNFGLQKGEFPKLLRIIFSWEDGCPRVRETYGNEVMWISSQM